MYGIRGINLACFCNYLENRKQYLSLGYDLKREIFLCSPSWLNTRTIAFLLYVNDLSNFSVLDLKMFADDANLFFEHTNLRISFSIFNEEQNKIYEWFNVNKLS